MISVAVVLQSLRMMLNPSYCTCQNIPHIQPPPPRRPRRRCPLPMGQGLWLPGRMREPEHLKELDVYNQVLHPSGHAFPCENTSTVTPTQARSHHPGPSGSEQRPLFQAFDQNRTLEPCRFEKMTAGSNFKGKGGRGRSSQTTHKTNQSFQGRR